jgi:hypothetical protein
LAVADRLQKITFGELRDMGVRGVLVYVPTIAAATRWHSARIAGRMI